MKNFTVSAGYAKGVLDYAALRGANKQALLALAQIDENLFDDADNRIPMERYRALILGAKEQCAAPAFALEFCDHMKFEDLSVVGLICQSAPTMGEVLEQLSRYSKLVAEVDLGLDGDRFSVEPNEAGLWIVDNRIGPADFPELAEMTFASFICEFRRHFGNTPFALRLQVCHAAPSYAADYQRILNVPVEFGAVRNAMQIDPNWLSVKVEPANPYLFSVLVERGEALLSELDNSNKLTTKIEKLILPILHTGEINMEHVAKQMGQSRQTLYRKLKVEGTTFEALLDHIRHKMALHYLDGKKVSVNEVAFLVGFSDPSSFSRAFKRWTGDSPGRVRALEFRETIKPNTT
ncbi:AraC family transcriptional regulator [Maritalea sp.]|uniref:AraC family transcriptional regulator n=1 Tax=Maritalea sp. TaxID=2003361 RepID=UPI003EF858A2